MTDKSLKNQEQVKKTLQQFLDLPGFKKISNRKIIKQSIATYNSINKIKKASRVAIADLNKERYKLARKISVLDKAGYKSSKSTVTLKKRLVQAKTSYEHYKNTIAVSEKMIKILKAPVSDHPKDIITLEKKIALMKNEIINYGMKIKRAKAKQLKGINLQRLNQQYQGLVNKFIKLPNSREFVLINRISTDAYIGKQQINIKWSRDFSTLQSPNNRTEFYGIINYVPNYTIRKNEGMIYNKYPILRLSESSISVKVGDFTVILNSSNRNLYDKKSLLKAVKEFYDLNAIANALN